jgi:hypothetical protein
MAYIETTGFRLSKKKRNWTSILLAAIALVSLVLTGYFSIVNVDLQRRNQDLQNSVYNYEPFIFANTSTSNLNTVFYNPNGTDATFFGNVTIDLKVITPYDGMLTIKVKSFNFSYLNGLYNPTLPYLDKDRLNSTFIYDESFQPHQYFVSRDVTNSIEDKIPLLVTVFLKLHLLSSDLQGMGFTLGDAIFEASLYEVRTHNTITQSFNEPIWVYVVSKS